MTAAGPCYWVAEDLCSGCANKLSQALRAQPSLNLNVEDVELLQEWPPLQIVIPGSDDGPVVASMNAPTAFLILGALQLVLRHPSIKNMGPTVQAVESFGQMLQAYLSITRNLAEVCEAGWNPSFDVPSERRIIVP